MRSNISGLGSLIDGCIKCGEAVVVYDVGVRINEPYINLMLYYFCVCGHRDKEHVVVIKRNNLGLEGGAQATRPRVIARQNH